MFKILMYIKLSLHNALKFNLLEVEIKVVEDHFSIINSITKDLINKPQNS